MNTYRGQTSRAIGAHEPSANNGLIDLFIATVLDEVRYHMAVILFQAEQLGASLDMTSVLGQMFTQDLFCFRLPEESRVDLDSPRKLDNGGRTWGEDESAYVWGIRGRILRRD